MYKAIKEIGGYKIGEEIPTDQALIWKNMYSIPHVEEVVEESTEDIPEDKSEEVVEESTEDIPKDKSEEVSTSSPRSNAMHDDYLNRNADVVRNAIKSDNLSKDVLESLKNIESRDKNRSKIMNALKVKLNKL